MDVASAASGSDRWVWWPTASTVGMAAFFVVVVEIPGPLNTLLSVLAIMACPGVALLLAGRAFWLFWRRQHRGALSACLAIATPALLLSPMALAAPYLHLGLTLAFGLGYLGVAPKEGQPVGIYDWTTGMVGGPNTFLIHDTTDAVATPEAKSNFSVWPNNDFLKECAGRSRHLIGHYYVCTN